MRRAFAPAGLVLGIILLVPVLSVRAQEALPVQITAETFRYDARTKVLTAIGHVILTFQDVRVFADALVANLETGDVTAEGHVRLEAAGQSAGADVLTYNLHTRFGTLRNARTDYTGPLVVGPVHLRAEHLEGVPGETATARGGFLTTCDERDPLVHLTAEEVTVYLNDRIVGRDVTLWVAGRRTVTWPYFQIFLRERRQSRLGPVVGYTETEGFFVKTTYSYVVNEQQYGFLYGDWMQRLGVGVGIEHIYQSQAGQGSAFLYRLANRQTAGTDLHAVVTHTQRFTPNFSAWVYADYFSLRSPLLTTTGLFGALDLAYTTPQSATYLFAAGGSVTPGDTSFLTGLLAHSQSLGPALFGQAFLSMSRSVGPAGTDDEALPRIVLSYFGPRFTAGLIAETRWDLDGGRFTLDDRYSLERLPELTFGILPLRLGNTLLFAQVQGGVGNFRESPGSGGTPLQAIRADATVTVSGPVALGEGTLGVRTYVRGSWYSSGDVRAIFGGRLDFTQRVGTGFGVRLGYTGQGSAGASPFLFDGGVPAFSVADAQVFYQSSTFLAQATAYYDFPTGLFGNVLAQAIYQPRPEWVVGTAASYNLQAGRLDRAELAFDLHLGKDWQVQYSAAYDGISRRVFHDRVAITRVFCDCLAVSLTYYGARREIWLEGWLVALPWARGRIGVGDRGTLLFDLPYPPYP